MFDLHVTNIFFSAGKRELSRRSQVIQRELPRPADINMNILRPYMDTPLTDLQRVSGILYI